MGRYDIYQWPYTETQRFSNSSCGVSLVLDRRRFSEGSVVATWSPPKHLQGRGGALHVRKRGVYDFVFIVLYLLPRPQVGPERTAVEELLSWAEQ
eukprot:4797622-Heterocapsa_arctica.AAC.1